MSKREYVVYKHRVLLRSKREARMQTLDFTPEEVEALRELVKSSVTGMDREVMRTDTREFKAMLKHRREVFEQVLAKLEAGAPVAH